MKALILFVVSATIFLQATCTETSPPQCTSSKKGKPCREICGKDEIYVECPFGVCVPKICDDVGYPVPCPDLLPNATCPDGPGCICKENYVRTKSGICVPMTECPSCGGDENAISGCSCNNCYRLCSNYNKPPQGCTKECLYNSCQCRKGYVYDEIKRICVYPRDCSKLKCTEPNEVYDPCPAPCPLRTCGIDDEALDCIPALPPGHPDCAPPTCRCNDGFFKNDVGQCVSEDMCPVCTGLNEIYDPCRAPCPPQRCDIDITVILCLVPPQVGDPDCDPGCRCIDGYVRNYTGLCIPREDCPKCPPNQIYDECDAPCPGRRCDVDERLIRCAAPPKPGSPDCVVGCRCIDGYVKDYNDVCIPKEKCPKCTKPHEVYDPCPPSTCPPPTCENVNKKYNCPNVPVDDKGKIIQTCDGQCVCEEGFFRNLNGECIAKEDCLKCTGPHEYFSCGPACDNECTLLNIQNQTNCPMKNVKCNPMCYCEEGYARDENKICVPIEDCNVPKCKKKEIYDPCPSCKPLNCSQVGIGPLCESFPLEGTCFDPPGCVCKEGYVRDDKTAVCIPKQKCPSCGGDRNATAGCGVNCNKRCRDIGKEPGDCILICYENDCDCKDGYFLDENTDQCVKPEDCTPACPFNEIYSTCKQAECRPKTCSQLGYPVSCPRIDPKFCKKGCICKNGYVRDKNGICIPEINCPPQCPKNEYYSSCTNADCSVQNCTQLGFPIKCSRIKPESCKQGCLCNEGYARNRRGVCVPINKCPKCKGDSNRKFGCGVYCNQRCSDIGIESKACIEVCYENACDCEDGYYLDEVIDKCVLPEDCTPPCPKNEYFNSCTNGDCSVQNCTQVGFPIKCPKIKPENCKKGCLCQEGYARNRKGVCVPINKCPSCGGDRNATAGCGVNCNKRCRDIGKEPGDCILICYENDCDCKDGYFLDENTDQCVKPEDCTPVCPFNEIYSTCKQGECRPKTCSQLGYPVSCPRIDPKFCKKGCICKNGYVRDKNGICIPEINCPPECPKNEYYSSCTNADCSVQNCTQLGFPIKCSRIKPESCEKGCLCNEGYARNRRGVCVPINKCPKCKGDSNRKFGCGVYCNQRCSDIGLESKACIEVCYENACDCEDGYYLDEVIDKCVLPEDCTPPCPKNEYFNSCTNGDCSVQNCTQVGFPIKCPKIKPENCKKGCLCQEGYARNRKGVCVPINKCPPVCSKNEVYSECVNGGCDPRNCSQLGKNIPCVKINPKYCIKGCVCKKGYLRDENGVCVPESECNPQCGLNKMYNACPYDCPPNTCESLDRAYVCPIRGDEERICKGRCVCKQGYYRNKIGDCISEADCRKCMGPNEFFSCGGACDNVCSSLSKQNQTNCPIINIQCNRMCYCEKNYARAKNNTCIPIDSCNEPQCGVNEKLETCPGKLRGPSCCSQLGYPLKDNSEKPCGKSACVCIDGYVRNKQKVCIPKEECPSCGGDPNAQSGCGINCGKLCRDAKNPGKPRPCPKICKINACDCKNGFYLDQNTDQCVKAEECSPSCDQPNEEYDPCTNGGCGFRNCSQLGGPNICIDPIKCTKGCKCKQDYLRLKNGTCVPVETCPEAKCRKNERFVKCPIALCEPLTCDVLGFPIPCPALGPDGYCPGAPGCICKDNYVRNAGGKCIPKEKCPSCGGDPYARSGCGVNCGTHCDDVFNISRPCPRICYPNDCDCVKGYFYDEVQEKCVTPDKCIEEPENCPTESCVEEPSRVVNTTEALINFQKGNNDLTANFIRQLVIRRPGESFLFSAFSVLITLAQLALYAVGATFTQLMTLLNLQSKDEIRSIFPILIDNYASQNSVIFEIAIKYYGNINVPFSEKFKQEAVATFNSEGESIDFSKNVEAADTVNEWVANKTNNLIKELVNTDMFSKDTRMVLVNALYFLGDWVNQFNPNNTKPRDFYIGEKNNDVVTIPMMTQQGRFLYFEDKDFDCQVLQLPYKGQNFTIEFYLPNKRTGLWEMVNKIKRNSDNFFKIRENLRYETVKMYIPKMEISTDLSDLVDLLKEANLTAPFNQANDEFKCIFEDDTRNVFVSDMVQKAYINVNEKGTEAAVATGLVISTTSAVLEPLKVYTFDFNHPGVFFLMLKDDFMDIAILAGTFTGKSIN